MPAILLLLAACCLLLLPPHAQARTLQVRRVRELRAALMDSTVDVVEVTTDLELVASEWPAEPIITLERNVTITSPAGWPREKWPIFDYSASVLARIRLRRYTALTFSRLYVFRARAQPQLSWPGTMLSAKLTMRGCGGALV